LSTGNESTYTLLARRTLINPGPDWAYYMLNFVTPESGISDSTENGIMIWANNEGNIWMDDAKLVYLGTPKFRPTTPYLSPPDYDIIVNHTYHYAVTAVDRSIDGNLDDGFPSNGNEGDFVNVGIAYTDELSSYFDTVFDSIYDSVPWLLPSARTNGIKSGTTPTMRFIVGATPASRLIEQFGSIDRTYDSDNLFRNGDYISLQFRMVDPYRANPDSTILASGGNGGLEGDFTQLDTGLGWYATDDALSADGYYSFVYRITTNSTLIQDGLTQMPDTPYNTVLGRYESMYLVRMGVRDYSGNGPTFSPSETDSNTDDNNPDTTYMLILDNETPNVPY